jgi:hypothetical protein
VAFVGLGILTYTLVNGPGVLRAKTFTGLGVLHWDAGQNADARPLLSILSARRPASSRDPPHALARGGR